MEWKNNVVFFNTSFKLSFDLLSENSVTIDMSRSGNPTDNEFIESFNGSLRNGCLHIHYFLFLEYVQGKLDRWRMKYNHEIIYSSLSNMTPVKLIRSLQKYEDL
ncbi:transposase [Pectobacterium sp. A535-S3-A17]|uniref:integrase core domain-containing protein n=1 Tax=Pectobacterium quasiaquaticum TaxID=2774015 RepID=UPI001876A0C5|nr:integrase core domain-containing protein [Pectobacterium quasiaquaticum]MBE5214700.1 transposase [Pectobacterium quasiaquaticum]MBE5224739.1 transposase [Pectobacterium quasiaquaticum]